MILDQRTLNIKYRVPAADIVRISLSPYLDDIAVFHVKSVRLETIQLYIYIGLLSLGLGNIDKAQVGSLQCCLLLWGHCIFP